MIGHESIISRDDIRCQCGHILVPVIPDGTTVWSSTPEPFSLQAHVEALYDAHVASIRDTRLYGFEYDEYLQTDPVTVYENWWDDNDHDDKPESLEIVEWSTVDLNTQITPAHLILERLAENIGDEFGYGEAGEAADKACQHPEVIEACERLRSTIAAHFTGWFAADKKLRVLTVTWDDNGQPLLDGEPMYVKAAK
jgi:hypothetical protein